MSEGSEKKKLNLRENNDNHYNINARVNEGCG